MVAKQGTLPSAKTVEGHRHRNWHVHTDHTGLHASCEVARRVAIPRKDCSTVSVLVFIDHLQRSLKVVDARHAEHWSKNLFVVDPHCRLDVVEQTRSQEEAVAFRQRPSPAVYNKLRAFLLADIKVARHLLKVLLCNQGAQIGFILRAVSNTQSADALLQLFDQRVGSPACRLRQQH